MAKTSASHYAELGLEELTLKLNEAMASLRFDDIAHILPILGYCIETTARSNEWAIALARRASVRLRFYGDNIGGLEDALNAYYYFQEVKDEVNEIQCSSLIAFCYMRAGLVDEAITYLKSAHIIAQKNNMFEQVARSLKLLADVNGIMQNYEAASTYCKEALELCLKHNLTTITLNVNLSLAQACNHMGKYQEALSITASEISARSSGSDPIELEMSYTMRAITYQMMGEYNKALSILKKSEKIFAQLPTGIPQRWQLMLRKGLCLYESGKAKEAIATGKMILRKCPIKNDLLFLEALHNMLSSAYHSCGDTIHADKHAKIGADLQLQNKGEELQVKAKSLMIAFDAERFQLEAQLERRRSQQLEVELQNREKELTMLALNLAQKNEMLTNIEHKLQLLEKSLNGAQMDTQSVMKLLINDVKADINSAVHADKAWKTFEQQFVSIHPNFLERLSQKHTNFKPMELRLCALIKVNLSTKQIANILCIDSATVDVYRSRIRRKMGLERQDNLTSYICGV
jgi:tetratricopeptide (TPR) repeat protein